ncbi:hypothetical protein K2173_010643 [Erythroxylum novogranatense]|uniref:EF-hand domain-containing protein n=1 Tax=Erythroxylum novogranatense TaxID=1862640 RepID=A0AAV8TEF0_9ROSI|nr:hypothetical protein K2173_010643 [Erythroxylum novogranatense]
MALAPAPVAPPLPAPQRQQQKNHRTPRQQRTLSKGKSVAFQGPHISLPSALPTQSSRLLPVSMGQMLGPSSQAPAPAFSTSPQQPQSLGQPGPSITSLPPKPTPPQIPSPGSNHVALSISSHADLIIQDSSILIPLQWALDGRDMAADHSGTGRPPAPISVDPTSTVPQVSPLDPGLDPPRPSTINEFKDELDTNGRRRITKEEQETKKKNKEELGEGSGLRMKGDG